MKKYKKLLSFGCSHTEGGGLNSKNWHRYISGDNYVSEVGEGLLPEHREYARQQSYPGYLSRILNCNFENFGTGRASNEFIFKMAYENIKNLDENSETLITVQTSYLNRILVNIPDLKIEYNVNSLEMYFPTDRQVEEDMKKYYETYVTRFFDETYEFQKVIRNIDLLTSYCKLKNIDILFLIWDKPNSYKHPVSDLEIKLNAHDGERFGRENKLQIADLPDCKYIDCHYTPKGHELLAEKIYKNLKIIYD